MKTFLIITNWLIVLVFIMAGFGFIYEAYQCGHSSQPPVFAVALLLVFATGCFYVAYHMYQDTKMLRDE